MSKKFKYILLANANGYKAQKVLKILLDKNIFTPQNCLVVTTNNEGTLATVAKQNQIQVISTDKNKIEKELSEYAFDFLISCGWNYKISDKLIAMASVASINCHSAYLPDYKGAGAHKHAWANAEPYTGTTIHLLSSDFDGGNIIEQAKIKITLFDTPNSLIRKIAEKTAELLPHAFSKLENNDFGSSQKDLKGRYFFKTSNRKLFLLRIINILLKPFNKTVYTKSKEV